MTQLGLTCLLMVLCGVRPVLASPIALVACVPLGTLFPTYAVLDALHLWLRLHLNPSGLKGAPQKDSIFD